VQAFDRGRLIAALATAATALYLMAVAPGMRYRRAARVLALLLYATAVVAALAWAALWALSFDG